MVDVLGVLALLVFTYCVFRFAFNWDALKEIPKLFKK